MIAGMFAAYERVVQAVQTRLVPWLPGLLARCVFAAVLLPYFYNSATRKLGDGLSGWWTVTGSAYFQIVPSVVERFGFDPSQVPAFPYGVLVYLGTYSELLLPVLIVAGLFTRFAALGMIVFVAVQSYVDIAFLDVDAQTVGALFDRFPDSAIADQRTLWGFLLAYLVMFGAGRVSADAVILGAGRRLLQPAEASG